jgi:hypothetical protein
MMDLLLVPSGQLEALCRTKRVVRIDRAHFAAAGVRPGGLPAAVQDALAERRAILERLGCAPPLPPSRDFF